MPEHLREVSVMNIGVVSCGILMILFAVVGILFAWLKENAAKFVSGFHMLSEEEQARCDKALISRDMRNQCFIWTAIMLMGTVLSYLLTPYMAIPAFLIWLLLFFRDVHLDARKAFEKYMVK